MRALFRLTLLQMLGRKKFWILILFLGLPVVLVGLVLAAGGFRDVGPEETETISSIVLYVLYPQSMCLLAALVYGASLLAGEIEDKTLVYLFTRAQPRWKVLFGKYVITVLILGLMTNLSFTICYLMLGLPGGFNVYAAVSVTIFAAILAYTAIFCLFGLVVPRRAIPIGILYGFTFEVFLASVPAVINVITVSHYLRSLALRIADIPVDEDLSEVLAITAGASPLRAVTAISCLALLTLCLSGLLIHRREWPLNEEA